ncbi:MAG: CpaF family protein [Candidatus Diapherotrites archaeon]|nr:CpaF family protein [Candidatus Diapherotrites archaeon]
MVKKNSGIEDIKGKILESYDSVEIFEGFPQNFYVVSFPEFTEKEQVIFSFLAHSISGSNLMSSSKIKGISSDFFSELNELIIRILNPVDGKSKLLNPELYSDLKRSLSLLLKKYVKDVSDPLIFSSRLIDESVGYGLIASLIEDEKLEEVMINGAKKPIYVYHKRYGLCKTNLMISSKQYLDDLIAKIAETCGRKISENAPLLDARLPDGSRANATDSYVTPFGATLTIRKFTHIPLSVIDLINNKTLSSDVAAFLWVMVEGLNIEPMNMIISGGTGSGKTATLNVLTSFIRYSDRIITIEDTLELHLGSRENWVQMEAKPRIRELQEVSMNDLLKNSLRMRPDRIILGEVRGEEAQTLFVAMDTGHKGSMGTLHSNTAKDLLIRLESNPMSVPESMIPLLDLILVQSKYYIRGKGIIRRMNQITELTSLEGKPLLANVFEWDKQSDEIKRTNIPSHTIELLAERTAKTKKEVLQEIGIRKRILDWLVSNKITSTPQVETIIQKYYHNPEEILENVVNNVSPKF